MTSSFNDGKEATATSQFLYQKDFKPVTITGKDWNTLLQNASHSGGINDSQIKLPCNYNGQRTQEVTSSWPPPHRRTKVFIATTDDNTSLNTYICAFDFHSGKQLWKFRTENSVKNTIACENEIVVAQDASCNLYALDAASGKPLWQQYINLKNYPYLNEGLTVDKGIVYAGIGAGLSAYDLKTGKVIWTNTDWKQREGSTTTLTIAGDVLISGTQWGGLYGNDIPHWQTTLETLGQRTRQPRCLSGLQRRKIMDHLLQSFFLIEPQTGKITPAKELSANLDVTSTPLVTEHEIIFGSADRGIFALDKPTLFIKWRAETLPSLVYTAPYSSTPQATVETSPVSSQGIVYIGASDGYLYAIDQSTGIIKDKLYFGAPVFSTVAVSGNRMIVCDFAGNVYCLSSKAAEE